MSKFQWYSAKGKPKLEEDFGFYFNPKHENSNNLFFREHEDKILVHIGPPGGQAIIPKEQILDYIEPSQEPVIGNEANEGFERSFWEYINAKTEWDKKKKHEQEKIDWLNSLSSEDKQKHERTQLGLEVIKTGKTKKDQIVLLHQYGFSKQEIPSIIKVDFSYLEEIYTKFIPNSKPKIGVEVENFD